MSKHNILKLLFLSAILLFILAACEKPECKKDTDCAKPHFEGSCVDKKCKFEPIPGECGNKKCEEPKENQCNCAIDCGECTGKVGTYLTGICTKDDVCMLDIPEKQITPMVITGEQPSAGDKFKVALTFNQPFNMNKNTIALRIELSQEEARNTDRKIKRVALSGMTQDKRTLTMTEKNINKMLWGNGYDVRDELIVDFPAPGVDGELTNLLITVDYEYVTTVGTALQQKTSSFQIRETRQKFVFVKPTNTYPCADCDDKNPGTKDECGPETKFFCQHTPIQGACGNAVCDGAENKCTCAADCGPCSGSGVYTLKTCSNNQCIAQLKPGITAASQSIFDDRNLNVFYLQTYFKYTTPFNTQTDKFTVDTTLYQLGQNVGNVQIEAIRLMDGSVELAATVGNKPLPSVGSKQVIEITVPPQGIAEQERNPVMNIYYSYDQNGPKKGQFQKPLGKIVFVSPQ